MANQLNRTVIACSALALAIVTLYYWQLRKRRKIPRVSVETDLSNSTQANQKTNKISEDSSNQVNRSVTNPSEESNSSASLTSIIEKVCSLEDGRDKLSIETDKAITVDYHDKREDDSEATFNQLSNVKLVPSKQQSNTTVIEQIELHSDQILSSQNCPQLKKSTIFSVISSEVLESDTEILSGNTLSCEPSKIMHLKNSGNISPAFSNSTNGSSDNDELDCKFKQQLSLTEEPTSPDLATSSIELGNDSIVSNSVVTFDHEVVNETEAINSINDDISFNTEHIIASNEGNRDLSLTEKIASSANSDGLIVHSNSDTKADNSESTGLNVDDNIADSSTNSDRNTPLLNSQHLSTVQPAVKSKPKTENKFISNTVKPNQTFAQALSSKNNKIMESKANELSQSKSVQNVDESGSDVVNPTKEEPDVYHDYPDATIASSEGQCSPNSDLSDIRSQGSNDSGKGGSEILHSDSTNNADQSSSNPYHIVNSSDDQVICYQFEMPQYLIGKLIGSSGYFINGLKQKSDTQIVINPNYYNPESKICSITGIKFNVMNALNLIRRRFPLKDYPNVTLTQINIVNPIPTIPLSQACQLHLPPDIVTDVILSCTINAGHFFLQQPTHPSYTQLNQLDYCMKENYSQENAPQMPQVYPGIVCAAPTAEGWYRALVKNVHESNTECDIMFVDYGGYGYNVPISTLRQIRYDFLSLPFQASECYLANVLPVDAQNDWSTEANNFFEELAQGQIIYASIIGYVENDVPVVDLFKLEGTNRIYINQQLVEKGFGVWAPETAPSTVS